jgi:MFS family permease
LKSSSVAAFQRVLRSGPLRRLLGSFFFFSLAEWGTWVAVLVWAHDAGGAGFVGVVAAVQLLFAAAAAPVIASIGDRMSRGRALALAYAAIGVSLVGTGAVLLADLPTLVILAASSVATALISVGRPIHASLVPDLSSEPADAVAANVVSSMVEGAGTFLGPGFAGLVLLVSGPGLVFVVLGTGVIVGSLIAVGMGHVARAGMLTEESAPGVTAAFRVLRRTPTQRFVLLLGGTSQFVAGAVDVLSVVLAIEVLGIGESGAGLAMSLVGIGGLAGAMLASSMVGRRLAPVLVGGALLRGGALMLLGMKPAWMFLFVVVGAGLSLIEVGVRTLLQRLAAPDVMSRVFGVLEGVGLLGLAGGSLLASGMIAAFGVQVSFVVFGGLVPMVVILGYKLLVTADRQADLPEDVLDAFGNSEMFGLLNPATRELLARRSRIQQFSDGEVLIREGEMSTNVLLLTHGAVKVTKDDRHLAHLDAGEIVGEIAALHRVPRTATVTADGPVTAIGVPGEAFVAAVQGETEAWSLTSGLSGRRLAQQ